MTARPSGSKSQAATQPALAQILQTLRQLLPAAASALAPRASEGTDWETLGASGDAIRAFALEGLTRRMSVIGVTLKSL